MTDLSEREQVMLQRAAATKALMTVIGYDPYHAERRAAELYPLPTRTVPTVRQGVEVLAGAEPCWYRVFHNQVGSLVWQRVERYYTRANALNRVQELGGSWPPEDQPTVAALLLLPLTEEVSE